MIKDILKWLYHRPRHWLLSILAARSGQPIEVSRYHKVLIISPHPDDEVFGCGGLIHELASRNIDTKVVILSQGEAAVPDSIIPRVSALEPMGILFLLKTSILFM